MSRPAISVENISKAYRIGLKEEKFPTFRDAMVNMAAAPLRRLRRLGGEGDRNGDDTFWALKDVSFEVPPGEVVGIIGRNGAGKSTLLKVLSRITEPTAGQIRLRGRVASLLEVGTGFHPELTGRENIYLNGAILGMKRAEITRKFDEIVAFAEVEKFLDTPVKHYSSGMYVRLAFAVAAHLEPEILIVDEVLAVGDAEFQKKCLGKMQEVSKGEGRTVLFVSHNLAAVKSLCDRGILFTKGVLTCDADSDSVANAYTRSSDAATSDLSARLDRRGIGTLVATDIRLMNSASHYTGKLRCGENVTIELDYKNFAGSDLRHVRVGIGFYDLHGHAVTFLQNEPLGVAMVALGRGGTFRCGVPRLRLVPGRYWINCAIYHGTEEYDVVERATSFEVVEGDFFGTGKLTYGGGGGVLIEQEWSADTSASGPSKSIHHATVY
jgi:lipopolysaccharide transport system ATP-binding protein